MIIYGNTKNYEIYSVYKIKQTDMSCISQDTNNLKILTLITCDNLNDSFRIVVKAKEIV